MEKKIAINSTDLQIIENKIYEIREQQVMLDFELADMYEIENKNLKRAVKRNIERFPEDFMFELSKQEWANLRCQFGTSSWGGSRYQPFAFTEQGVAMLSSVLKSPKAIEVNINIMRAFVAVRRYIVQLQNTQTIEERIKSLEQANEELLKDMNDLSEDTQKSFDELFNSFARLANKVNVSKKIENEDRVRIIGFSQKQN
ncbi:MAG: ORF6N domain-containing protein [Prevotellaceae bacterium]|jgi:hypothetical protein|nr:ORF6N domain-containing protein [Prevotellaceae bacterium]